MENTISVVVSSNGDIQVEYFLFQGKSVGVHKFDGSRTVHELIGQLRALRPLQKTTINVLIK